MKSTKIALFALLASAAIPAAAATLTFEGASNNIYAAPIVRDGYSIGNIAGDEQHFHEIDSTAFSGFVVSNGTGVLYNDRDTSIFIESATTGATFTLNAFDASAVQGTSAGATNLLVQGFLNGNLVNQGTYAINATSFTTYALGLSGTFDRVVFNGLEGGGGFELDNVALNAGNAVPEPATWAMMIGGFGLAGAAMRRRARTTVSFG